MGPHSQIDTVFQELKDQVTPPARTNRAKTSWISDDTWKLVDSRAAMRRDPNLDRSAYRQLHREVKASVQRDRVRRTEAAAEDIGKKLDDEDVQGAWSRLKAWYKHAGDRPCAPSRADLKAVSDEYHALYEKESPPGEPIPVLVAPFDINDDIPTEDEIERHVNRLRAGKAPGHTKMRADDLKAWLDAAKREEMPDGTNWCRLVWLVQEVFRTGVLPAGLAWSTMVLLPKGSGGFRGIGLLEIVWKLITSIMNGRIMAEVKFHDALHGFLPERGTGTATIEAKLLQQLAGIAQVPLFEVFLDLKKAYDTLDRDRTLAILEAYGVGPRILALLKAFWEQQLVVARQGKYHGEPFEADRGVTQGDIVSPTIFNIVCDAVVRAWLLEVSEDSDDASVGIGSNLVQLASLFYADDGMIASRSSEWLQQALVVLTDLFRRCGLKTNTTKTVAMTCVPGHIRTNVSQESYRRRTREVGGPDPRARQRRRVECSECGKSLAAGSLRNHLLTQHGIARRPLQGEAPTAPPAEYTVSFPKTLRTKACPVAGCGGSAKTHQSLRRHFLHRHVADTLVILQEGSHPLPRCELCDMFVPASALSSGHQRTAYCRRGADAKRRRHVLQDLRRADEIVFTACGVPLDRVSVFKYLGRVLSESDSDWPALYANLKKARKRWGMVSRVLRREGLRPRVAAMFYKAVVQSVLLFGSETWSITPQMLRALTGFHHRVARQLTGKVGRYLPREDRWVYPPVDEVLAEAGLFTMEEYITRRQNRLADYVATRPIFELCMECERPDGSSRAQLWWEQKTVDSRLND